MSKFAIFAGALQFIVFDLRDTPEIKSNDSCFSVLCNAESALQLLFHIQKAEITLTDDFIIMINCS